MKKQLNEIKRIQQLAGIKLNELEVNNPIPKIKQINNEEELENTLIFLSRMGYKAKINNVFLPLETYSKNGENSIIKRLKSMLLINTDFPIYLGINWNGEKEVTWTTNSNIHIWKSIVNSNFETVDYGNGPRKYDPTGEYDPTLGIGMGEYFDEDDE